MEIADIKKSFDGDAYARMVQFRILFEDRGASKDLTVLGEDRPAQQGDDLSSLAGPENSTTCRLKIDESSNNDVGVEDEAVFGGGHGALPLLWLHNLACNLCFFHEAVHFRFVDFTARSQQFLE